LVISREGLNDLGPQPFGRVIRLSEQNHGIGSGSGRAVRFRKGLFDILIWVLRLPAWTWRLARAHGLNPWVFVAMSALGWMIQAMVYLPWFQGHEWQLSFLIGLRFVALVVPVYIVLKGRRIAQVFNVTLVGFFTLNTAWHVCYYVYL